MEALRKLFDGVVYCVVFAVTFVGVKAIKIGIAWLVFYWIYSLFE